MTDTSKHFGYWVNGKDMDSVNLETFKKNGVTDIFLNFYAFTVHGEKKVLEWIAKAKKNNIDVHIWTQCFYNGGWINPKTANLDSKLKEIKKYAGLNNVKGVHLDYLRYPGNAYKTSGGADAITNFVKKVRSQNPNTFVSCAIMPEEEGKYYYGQDLAALGKIVDAVLPMQYKGNYNASTQWLGTTTKSFSSKATIWSGLQGYKSDNDTTTLSSNELLTDIKTCLKNGAKGTILFRYGLSPNINFNNIEGVNMTKKDVIAKMAKEVKETVKKEYSVPKKSQNHTYAEYTYLFAKTIVSPGKDYEKKAVKTASNSHGTYISRTVKKSDYVKLAKNFITFVDKNEQLPNYLTYGGYKLAVRVYIDAFARIVDYYYTNKQMPSYVNVNSNAFTKPTTTSNTNTSKDEVFTYFVKKFGNVTTIDDALEKVKSRSYGYYYDDVYSNKTAIDRMYSKSGINCTDSCQVFWHIAKALGYEVHCLHVRCSGGDGHVRLKLRHKKYSNNEWFYRDPAAVLDKNGQPVTYNWCINNYTLLATDPSWFLANINR